MKSTPRNLFAIACALASLPVGCGGSGPPPRRRPEVILSSPAVDEKIGKEASQDVAAQMGLLDDPELTDYVNQIGRRLARYAPHGRFEYHFAIIDQDAPNAFALPGGYIFVSRGLLVLSNTEDELANVIGHEIVHVAARHAAARQSVVRDLPGPFRFFAQGQIAGYSRDQEREADRLGQGVSALAGYDPSGLARFLKDLEFTERLRLGTSRLPSFLDTHPTTSERSATAAARARAVSWEPVPGIAKDRADYLRRLEGLVIGTGGAEGIFQGDRFLHPDLDFTMRFPDGWTTLNTRLAVGALAPRRDAQLVLEGQGRGDDPERAAAEFLEQPENRGFSIDSATPVKIGRFSAYRIEGSVPTPYGSFPTAITWIARDGTIFRITGMTIPRAFPRYAGTFRNVVRSFRPLPPALRSSVRELRLRIAPARAGESIKQLSERTHNEWNLQRTAVMNDLFADQPLEASQLLKIAVSTPYVSRDAPR